MDIQIVDSAEPLTEADIARVEQRIGCSVPTRYRTFLLAHNGGYPEPSGFRMRHTSGEPSQRGSVDWFLGIHGENTDNLEHYLNTYRDRIPSNLFPIAHDAGGNLICISTDGADAGKVYFWDHEEEAEEGETPTYDNLYLISDSFDEFLNNLGDNT